MVVYVILGLIVIGIGLNAFVYGSAYMGSRKRKGTDVV